MKKNTAIQQACISLISLLCFICSLSHAQSTIQNGSCPSLDEVVTTWETVATTYKAGGGWKVPKYAFSGTTDGVASAEKYRSCTTGSSSSSNDNKNRIFCTFALVDDEPAATIRVFKDKPENYNCSCNTSNGRYSCTVN